MNTSETPYRIAAICTPPEDSGLTLNQYQRSATTTCMESCDNR